MKLDVYSADFAERTTLYSAVSVSSTEFYNGLGKITVVAAGLERNRASLKTKNVIYDVSSGMTYIIVNVRYDASNDRITANGYSANWLLSRRAAAKLVKMPPGFKIGPIVDNVETDIYSVVTDNFCLSVLWPTYKADGSSADLSRLDPRISVAATKNLGIHIVPARRYSTYSGDSFPCVLDIVLDCLDAVNLGHRMNFNPAAHTWEFEIYQGQDKRSVAAFVEEHGTLGGVSFEFDASTFRNVAVVPMFYASAGTRPSATPPATIRYFGAGEGADRYETILPMQTEGSDESGYFEERVKKLAFEELSKCLSRQTFTVSGIDTADLGKKFALGDLIKCVSNRLGIEFDARITCIRRTFDSRLETVALVLGDPVLTVLSGQNFVV